MKQRKKGASYTTVLILMMALMIVGGATVTFTSFDVESREAESNRVENLYGAESGLEVAKSILYSASDYAITEAIEKSSQADSNVAETFEDTYIRALFDKEYEHNGSVLLGSDQVSSVSLLEYSLSNRQIPTLQGNNLTFQKIDITGLAENFTLSLNVSDDSKKVIELLQNNQRVTSDDITEIDLKVSSTYKLPETSPTGEGERIVSQDFSITLPTYSSQSGVLVPQVNQKLLAIDGSVYGGASVTTNTASARQSVLALNLNGNIWVKGEINGGEKDVNDVAYDKYQGGILLEKANVLVKGDVVTDESVSLFNESNLTVEAGNVYGENMYVGKRNVGSTSNKSTVSVSSKNQEVILNNDLVVNTTGSEGSVVIDKFFGIEDKNFTANSGINGSSKIETLATSSSAIIINQAGPSVEVKEEAYIGGLAMIDTDGEKYQTGESVSVKPNYMVYTSILPGYEDKVTLKYYNPLMLVEDVANGSKANYFIDSLEVWKDKLSTGGVKLPANTEAVGVYVNENGEFVAPSIPMESEQEIKNIKTAEFNKQVSHMNVETTSELPLTVHELFSDDFRSIKNKVLEETLVMDSRQYVEIHVYQNAIVFYNTDNKTSYRVDLTESEMRELFIVTRGDVIIKEDINMTGNIIASGDFIIDNHAANVTLTYDQDVTEKIVARYATELAKVFRDQIEGSVEVEVGTPNEEYNAKKLVALGRWTLEK